jgi:enoyl-CoA hydratase
MGMSWEQAWSMESLLGARAFGSEDAIEGPRAFMEKRDPVFKGR